MSVSLNCFSSIHAMLKLTGVFSFTAPTGPSNIEVVNYPDSFTVKWDTIPEDKYRIYARKWNTKEENTIFTPVVPPYNITGLESNTRYSIVVEAYNSLGGSNGSTTSITAPQGNNMLH